MNLHEMKERIKKFSEGSQFTEMDKSALEKEFAGFMREPADSPHGTYHPLGAYKITLDKPKPKPEPMRYEGIAWDGCADWYCLNPRVRKRARELKEWLKETEWVKVRIWDRKRKEFVR